MCWFMGGEGYQDDAWDKKKKEKDNAEAQSTRRAAEKERAAG